MPTHCVIGFSLIKIYKHISVQIYWYFIILEIFKLVFHLFDLYYNFKSFCLTIFDFSSHDFRIFLSSGWLLFISKYSWQGQQNSLICIFLCLTYVNIYNIEFQATCVDKCGNLLRFDAKESKLRLVEYISCYATKLIIHYASKYSKFKQTLELQPEM